MNQRKYDAIVIGGGHNGLVTAAYLGQAGLKTLVAERRAVLGGAAATEPLFPGYQVNSGAGDAGMFLPEIVRDLRLDDHGLRFLESPVLAVSLLPENESLTLWRDPGRTQQEIERFSPADAKRYPEYLGWLESARKVLRPLLTLTPPEIPDLQAGELLPWLGLGLRARRQGGKALMELLRSLPMPAEDFLNEWFETPALKGALAGLGLRGARLGPKAPGTTFLMLYHTLNAAPGEVSASRFVQGGSGELSASLARSARQYGVEICTGMNVAHLILEDGRVSGVLLEDGSQILASRVISAADPRGTFFELLGTQELEVRMVREVRNIRCSGSVARLLLTLDGLPHFGAIERRASTGASDHLAAHLLVCPDLEGFERAADAAKYGRLPEIPLLDVLIPSVLDPGLAPIGKHLATVDIFLVPHQLKGGSWESARRDLADLSLRLLERHAPGLGALITGCELLTPQDYEQVYGLPNGDPYHGQMGLDQLLFMRPVPAAARYRTPVDGLYLCGAGSHPGGGLTGAPGYNAAREVLKDSGIK